MTDTSFETIIWVISQAIILAVAVGLFGYHVYERRKFKKQLEDFSEITELPGQSGSKNRVGISEPLIPHQE